MGNRGYSQTGSAFDAFACSVIEFLRKVFVITTKATFVVTSAAVSAVASQWLGDDITLEVNASNVHTVLWKVCSIGTVVWHEKVMRMHVAGSA